jgi:hypothetical protein
MRRNWDILAFIFFIYALVIALSKWLPDSPINELAMVFSAGLAIWKWRKEKDLDYLIDAYKKISMGVDRDIENPNNFDVQRGFEEGVAIVQLYGTKAENEILHKIRTGDKNYQPLLVELRNRVRKELALEEIDQIILTHRLTTEIEKITNRKGNS